MTQFVERFHVRRPTNSPLRAPEADDSFTYLVGRAVTAFPTINGNNAAFLEEDCGNTRGLKSFIGTDKGFKFGLVNVSHSVGPGKPNTILGSIRDEQWVNDGVDIIAQIDKRACEAHSIEADEFANELGSFSIEIHCDRDKSTFIAMTNPASKKLEDQTVFSAEEAASQGIRRTSFVEPDPFLYQGKHLVVELCSPIRCRGVAVLPNPAEKTANVYEVAASLESAAKHPAPYGDVDYADDGYRGKKRYPVDTPEHVRAAASYFGQQQNRDKYTPEQQKHIQGKIDAAKKKFGIGDEEKADFSSNDIPSVTPMASYYDSVEPLDIDAAQHSDMPNQAFADNYFDPEDDADKRAYPLYASARHFVESKPHAGLVKAALQAHAAGKIQNPQQALQRLQVAHSQLHGAHSMTDSEKLASEKAALETKVAEIQASIEGKDTTIKDKDTEIAGLKDQVTKLSDEKAALEEKITKRESEEKANLRLAKLTAVEGFAVADEEKASLLEALKTEDELAFENRVLKAQIVSMEEAAKKAKKPEAKAQTDEEKAAQRHSEEAAAMAGIDIFPTHVTGKDATVDPSKVYAIM